MLYDDITAPLAFALGSMEHLVDVRAEMKLTCWPCRRHAHAVRASPTSYNFSTTARSSATATASLAKPRRQMPKSYRQVVDYISMPI